MVNITERENSGINPDDSEFDNQERRGADSENSRYRDGQKHMHLSTSEGNSADPEQEGE